MKRLWLVVLAGLFAASLAGCGKGNAEDTFPMSVEIGELEAVNQNGDTVKLSELNEDKIVIADFIFTNCDTVCLPMTANMAKLQNKIKEAGLQDDVQFVSISIDPEEDTPETLTEYSKRHSADYSNWTFLTGYTRDEIESFANVSFKTPAAKVEGSNQFVHATSFFLVGESGTLLNKYEGVSDPPFEEIIKDIEKLK
ncbi:SCO family protein [[Bacillus] enclensis]|uniref:SCO family protein n=1 Tax=[Bacillus] enclensis TaxID=1402860 RepID=UPI0018DC145F|nr:SCO family protein [[Bacillus] enclensis]MBH9968196.1 SCO family protein [[Bacillus] enclensis]